MSRNAAGCSCIGSGHSKPQITTDSVDLLRKMLVKVAPIKQQTNLKDALLRGIIFLLAWLIKEGGKNLKKTLVILNKLLVAFVIADIKLLYPR